LEETHLMLRLTLLLALVCLPTVRGEDWPQFRGPTGDGHYTGRALPTEWGTDTNVTWKTEIPGRGWSSPIVCKGKIFLTSAVGDSKPKSDQSLRAICLDAKKGDILWNVELFTPLGKDSPNIHGKNSHASPTPVTDGERVYFHFGHQGTAALDFDGKVIWKKKYTYNPVHGGGCSPILVDDLLVFGCDGGDLQFIVGLDKKTGDEKWKTERDAKAPRGFSFATPQVMDTPSGKVILSPASNMLGGYDPKTGKELWRFKYTGYSVIPRPVFGHGLVYVATSYDSSVVHAFHPEGTGDLTDKLEWTAKRNAPHTPSMLLVGDELYMVSDKGFATCLDAKTGKEIWSERLPDGGYSASPIYANGKIYVTNETGVGVVLTAGREFKKLSTNDMKEKTFASFAGVDGALFVRTESKLYRFDDKKQ
jgi:outer membrane protein assembly factor BamB